MTPREAGIQAFYADESTSNTLQGLNAAFDAYEAADQSRKVAEVARDHWWPDRLPQDFGERQLAAALIRAFGTFAREVCGCEDCSECDECPSQSQIDAFLARADADLSKSEEAIANYMEMLSAETAKEA
jgi:hypothetical protein